MDTEQAYDAWSGAYDTGRNRTRDLEALALREMFQHIRVKRCLEIGCGTGKNTAWLATRCAELTAVDLSGGMLAAAREKVQAGHVHFVQADIRKNWDFATGTYDLVTFSLVLEHIAELGPILRAAGAVLSAGGQVYIGELHPFKQYLGTKARFETSQGTQWVPGYDHHVSDFVEAGRQAGLRVEDLREFFDADAPGSPPRILALMLRRAQDPAR